MLCRHARRKSIESLAAVQRGRRRHIVPELPETDATSKSRISKSRIVVRVIFAALQQRRQPRKTHRLPAFKINQACFGIGRRSASFAQSAENPTLRGDRHLAFDHGKARQLQFIVSGRHGAKIKSDDARDK